MGFLLVQNGDNYMFFNKAIRDRYRYIWGYRIPIKSISTLSTLYHLVNWTGLEFDGTLARVLISPWVSYWHKMETERFLTKWQGQRIYTFIDSSLGLVNCLQHWHLRDGTERERDRDQDRERNKDEEKLRDEKVS